MGLGNAARRIAGKIFRSKADRVTRASARAFAEYVSGVEGSSLIWCSCGELLAPVVYSHGEQAEIVALGCVHGCGGIPVCVGVLIEDFAPSASG
jgi:hypothetical protein